MEFLPEDIENIILDYKKQFERKYDCSIKHQHIFMEKSYKKNIIFHEHPYKFECNKCSYKICDEHSDEYVLQHTRKNLCVNCHMTEVQIVKILKNIDYQKEILENELRTYKSILFFFKDEDINELNEMLKERLEELGGLNTDDLYDYINEVYNKLQFFDFFESEV